MDNIYTPSYYKKFGCIADKCEDTCCAYWEICIDKKTLAYYSKQKDSLSKIIKDSIIKDEDGDYIFKLNDGRCPFLNSGNLCDIYINYGEEHLCEVCREHPRFTEIYDDFTEISLSVSCPEANRIIFKSDYTGETYPVPQSFSDDGFLIDLIKYRSDLLNFFLYSDYNTSLKKLYSVCRELTEKYDYYKSVNYSVFYNIDDKILTDAELLILNKSEILTDKWKDILTLSLDNADGETDKNSFIKDNYGFIRKFFAYFTYRYFLKAINDCDLELTGAFIALSINLCIDISYKSETDFKECVRLFSKEFEHNLDNMDLLRQFITENGEEL